MDDETGAIFLVSEVVDTHSGKWLALEVVTKDENGLPQQVKLLATATDRLELREKIKSRSHVYIKYAGPLAPAGYGVLY